MVIETAKRWLYGSRRVRLPEKPKDPDGPRQVRDYLILMLLIQFRTSFYKATQMSKAWRVGTYKRLTGMTLREFERLFEKEHRWQAVELWHAIQAHADDKLRPRMHTPKKEFNILVFFLMMAFSVFIWITCIWQFGPNWFDSGVLNTISTVTLTLQCIHVCELSSWSREERLFSWLFIMQLYWYIGMLLIYVLQSSIFALFTASTGALAECSGFAQVGQYSEPCSLRTAWLRNLHKAIDPVDGN